MTPSNGSSRRSWLLATMVAVALQSAAALVLNFNQLRAWPPAAPSRFGDTDIYRLYAGMTLGGRRPYRDFRVEYPPLAVPLFLLPGFVAPGRAGFRFAFAAEMLLFHAATVALVARRVDRGEGPGRLVSRLAWYSVAFLMLSRLMVSRYDAAPAFLGFASAVWWAEGRTRDGGIAAALGTLMKIYPIVVALVASVGCGKGADRGRGTGIFGVALVLGGSSWLAFGGIAGVGESLRYHGERGLEYGSLFSGLQMLAAKVAGASIVVSRDHASFSTITPWSPMLVALAFPFQAAAVAMVVGIFLKRGGLEIVRFAGAAVLAFAATGKVFSPQYLIWVSPFVAILDGPIAARARRLFALACLLTLLAPALFNVLPRTSLGVILAFNLKNAAVLALLGLLTFGPDGSDIPGLTEKFR